MQISKKRFFDKHSFDVKMLRICNKILLRCPISSYLENINFPCKVGKRNSIYLQEKLDELDKWQKEIVVEIKSVMKSGSVVDTSFQRKKTNERQRERQYE